MLYTTGQVIQRAANMPDIIDGWRSFDVRSTWYDVVDKARCPMTVRWYFPDNRRFQNTNVPAIGTIVQLSGDLIGQHDVKREDPQTQDAIALLAAQISAIDFLSTKAAISCGSSAAAAGSTASGSPGTPSLKRSWGTSTATLPTLAIASSSRLQPSARASFQFDDAAGEQVLMESRLTRL